VVLQHSVECDDFCAEDSLISVLTQILLRTSDEYFDFWKLHNRTMHAISKKSRIS
jgi:hypothetical protein